MYRLAQETDFSEWKLYKEQDNHAPWAFAKKHKASRVTVLAISNDPEIAEAKDLKYAGPLYFDIDHEDLGVALDSGVELAEKLLKLGVSVGDLHISLSGSKGVHIFVDQRIFSSGRPLTNLIRIYKRMATELYVPGIDVSVYSAARGRMFRANNSLRPDKAYKVPVSFEELKDLTPAQYKNLVKKPRKIIEGEESDLVKAPALANLFSELKSASSKLDNKNVTISDEVLSKLEGSIPPCIEELASGKERDNTAFNKAAFNVACWAAKSLVEDVRLDSVMARIADNTTSKKYNSTLSRKRHMQGLKQYVGNGSKNYGFSCLGMLSVIKGHPCKDCALKDSNGVVLGDHSNYENMFVHANMGQYYSDPDFTKAIASFNMVMSAQIQGETSGKTEATIVHISSPISGYKYEISDFSEDAWTSKQKFKQELQGYSGIVFLGSDNDVAKLRLTVTKQDLFDITEMETKYKHSKVGIHYYRRKGPDNVREEGHLGKAVYVEKDFSVDTDGFPDSHILTGTVNGAPKLKKLNFNGLVTSEANEAFKLLLKTNNEQVIATLLGWFFSNHLKAHFFQIEKRYPLLYISGIAGTGKNSLIALWMRLAGLRGEEAMYTLEAPNSTKLPFQQGLTNSVTIPRVINELNPKSVSKQQYTTITELLKAAFDSQTISKGRIGGGDKYGANVSSIDWTITAPIVTLSEEPLNSPALLQRGIKVELNPQGHKEGSKAFYGLEYRADDLVSLAVCLIKAALNTPVMELIRLQDAVQLPEEVRQSDIPERLKHGFKMLLTSYDWAIRYLGTGSGETWIEGNCGLSADNLRLIKHFRAVLVDYITNSYTHIERESSVNEVDKIITDIAILAHSRGDSNPQHFIETPHHFVITEDKLYLDILTIYPVLQKFKAAVRTPLALQTADAFINSAKGLGYTLDIKCESQFMIHAKGRTVCEFDVKGLEKANIPVAMFRDND